MNLLNTILSKRGQKSTIAGEQLGVLAGLTTPNGLYKNNTPQLRQHRALLSCSTTAKKLNKALKYLY